MTVTLLDIAKSTGTEGLAALVEEVVKAVPELQIGDSRPIKGLAYKQNVRTALPGGSFRNANEGTAPVKSTFEERLFNCYIANPVWRSRYSETARALVFRPSLRRQGRSHSATRNHPPACGHRGRSGRLTLNVPSFDSRFSN